MFGTIENIFWLENSINLNNGYPIIYITPLKNNNFDIWEPIKVYFYSLSKYSSKLIYSHNINERVKKVNQLNDKEVII